MRHYDAVVVHDGVQSVRNSDNCGGFALLSENLTSQTRDLQVKRVTHVEGATHLLDHLVGTHVNVRGGFVQANDFVVLQ